MKQLHQKRTIRLLLILSLALLLPREEVFSIALQALMDEFGLSFEDVTAEPFLYGCDAESAMHRWQLSFASQSDPTGGYEYSVYIRDSDGAVLGVWGPEEANG